MNKKVSSIQRKLMRLVLVTSAVVLFLTCAGFLAYEFFTFRQASKDRLSTIGEVISANSTAALAFENPDAAEEILEALKAEKHIVAACLYDVRGNVFAKYPATISADRFPKTPGKEEYKYVSGYLEGFQPATLHNKRWGTLYLRSDIKEIYTRLHRYAMITLLVMVVAILVAYFLSRQLQKKISAPILSLADTAGQISERHDYTVRAKKFDDDEFGSLTDAFNEMLTRIHKQNGQITSLNRELEQKVHERTIELEQANMELKLKSDFEETIIDSSVDIIAVFDREFKYVILNKYGKKVFGVEDKDVIGKRILDIFPQIKEGAMYQFLQQAFEKGEMIVDEHYYSHISDRVMENYFIPLFDKDSKVYRVLVIGHDITEISKTNEKLKQVNYRLEKSNLDLEQFAFVASHDLQEPLRKIQTFSQLVEKNLDNKEAAKKHLAKIISSSIRMTDLIKAVLNYSRLSNEKGHFEWVNLNEIAENIKADLELPITEKEAVIKCQRLPVIRGNRLQLTQLFLNIVSNSIKFSKRQPEISISSVIFDESEIEAIDGFIANGTYVELTFKDNGIGFEQQYADRIFNVFQRLHGKLDYPGTGIGLALCKKIIDNHQGRISVKSTPGEGTEFRIYLPANLSSVS